MPVDWMPAELLGYVFVLLLVGVLLTLAFGGLRRRGGPSAEQILRRRFASGELSRRQYEEHLAELRQRRENGHDGNPGRHGELGPGRRAG